MMTSLTLGKMVRYISEYGTTDLTLLRMRAFARTLQASCYSFLETPVIVAAKRTPIGSFMGGLADLTAPELGAEAIRGVVESVAPLAEDPSLIEECLMGHVVTGGVGQAPARQAATFGGLPVSVETTLVNKVCASGMKSMMFGAQAIMCGQRSVVLAGGMESMTNIPYLVPKGRTGYRFGHGQFLDGLMKDGLEDAFTGTIMGCYADATGVEYDISREDQDSFAVASYERAAAAWEAGHFDEEVVPVTIQTRRGDKVVDRDEEFTNIDLSKIPDLRPAFGKEGTVTAANASTLSDGAAATILMSESAADWLGLEPLARIVSFADGEHEPEWFTTAPSIAMAKAMEMAGLTKDDITLFEINEAFSVVTLANMKILDLDHEKVNVLGGAVSLGHPLGCSGTRIVTTLIHALKPGELGLAGICNGGGGASAIIVERL